jgi:hypothetical protein
LKNLQPIPPFLNSVKYVRPYRAAPIACSCNKTQFKQAFYSKTDQIMSVILETSKGDIVIDLYVKDCPKACENFIK